MNVDLGILFTRPYWLDEWHAVLVANRSTPGGVLSDLGRGADFAPPVLHLSLWLLRALGGGDLAPAAARALMLAFTLGAVAFVFLLLRRRFDRAPSLAGAFAIAVHGLVWAYAFEVRFYAPWLFFAAMLAWSFSMDAARDRSLRRSVAMGIASVGLCGTHWFGVVTLGLLCLGAVLAQWPDWRRGVRRALPAVAGVVALAAFSPLLFGQRGSITEATWVADLSWAQFRTLAVTYWGAIPVLAALAALALIIVARRSTALLRDTARVALRDPSVAALLPLAVMPLVLTVVSLQQPAMLPRYGITTVLASAPLVAFVAQLLPRWGRVVAAVVLALGLPLQLGGLLNVLRQVDRIVATDRALLLDACRAGESVAFVTRVQMYYYADEIRSSCPRAAFLAIPQETLARLFFGPNAGVQRQHRVEAEFARLHRSLYAFPRTVTPAQLDSLPHFVVMAEPWSLPRDASGNEFFSRTVFPRHRATSLNGNGTRYTRAAAGQP